MARALVPVYIKPHLIPFLYQHFKSDDKACINGKKVKAVLINSHTSFGATIRLLIRKSNTKARCDKNPSIFLSLQEYEDYRSYFGVIYKSADGRSSFLELPQEGVVFINNTLQEMMDNAMLYFIKGFHEKEGLQGLSVGIHLFIEKYNLFEFGYDVAAIRQKYYRWRRVVDVV